MHSAARCSRYDTVFMFNNTGLLEKMRADQTAWLQRQRAVRFQQALAVQEERRPPHQFHFPISADWDHFHAQGLLSPRVQPLPTPSPVYADRPLWSRVRRWPHTSMMFLDRPDTAAIALRNRVLASDAMPVTATPAVTDATLEQRITGFDNDATERRR